MAVVGRAHGCMYAHLHSPIHEALPQPVVGVDHAGLMEMLFARPKSKSKPSLDNGVSFALAPLCTNLSGSLFGAASGTGSFVFSQILTCALFCRLSVESQREVTCQPPAPPPTSPTPPPRYSVSFCCTIWFSTSAPRNFSLEILRPQSPDIRPCLILDGCCSLRESGIPTGALDQGIRSAVSEKAIPTRPLGDVVALQ